MLCLQVIAVVQIFPGSRVVRSLNSRVSYPWHYMMWESLTQTEGGNRSKSKRGVTL